MVLSQKEKKEYIEKKMGYIKNLLKHKNKIKGIMEENIQKYKNIIKEITANKYPLKPHATPSQNRSQQQQQQQLQKDKQQQQQQQKQPKGFSNNMFSNNRNNNTLDIQSCSSLLDAIMTQNVS